MRIAILTSFAEINPGYSLTGIVEDQIAMLARYGHEVHIFTPANFNRDSATETFRLAELHPVLPVTHLVDYQSRVDLSEDHMFVAAKVACEFQEGIDGLGGVNVVFTHDWAFTGWNLPYFQGLISGFSWPDVKIKPCYHWIHSIPSANRDWWRVKQWPGQHHLVFPNRSDAQRVADQYHGTLDDVLVIPHIKDPRTWFDFSPETRELIDLTRNQKPETGNSLIPGLLSADIIQLLPASADRLAAKRVDVVIRLFAEFKKAGRSVCLVVANQWATGKQRREDVQGYLALAKSEGLTTEEVIFTSEIKEAYQTGISRRMVRELFQLSNLFIFPTDHESFGLVVPEAALAGVLPVLNKSLDQQVEISGGQALYFDFGSYTRGFRPPNGYWAALAGVILGRLDASETIRTKTRMRQHYNWDAVYQRYYAPLLAARLSLGRLKAQLVDRAGRP